MRGTEKAVEPVVGVYAVGRADLPLRLAGSKASIDVSKMYVLASNARSSHVNLSNMFMCLSSTTLRYFRNRMNSVRNQKGARGIGWPCPDGGGVAGSFHGPRKRR